MTDSAYKRGYEAARDELRRAAKAHHNALCERAAELTQKIPSVGIVNALGEQVDKGRGLTEYERGVLAGGIAECRTTLMLLGESKGEGTGKELLRVKA